MTTDSISTSSGSVELMQSPSSISTAAISALSVVGSLVETSDEFGVRLASGECDCYHHDQDVDGP